MMLRLCALALGFASSAASAAEIRFEVPVLPAFERHAELLAQPGIIAVALENADFSPSQSSKLKVAEEGRSAEIRNATLRFSAKKGPVFLYEAGYRLVGDTSVSFPVEVDLARVREGTVRIALSPPLATLIPDEIVTKIQVKTRLLANPEAQRKLLAYLDQVSKDGDPARRVLIDAYNRSGGPTAGVQDAGDALPLSDQWLLFVTLALWIGGPLVLLWRRVRRQRRAQS
jgi:hypothetical protein